MKIKAKDLEVGTVVMSGEMIVGLYRDGQKMVVTLEKKSGKCRTADWGYNSTIFCKNK